MSTSSSLTSSGGQKMSTALKKVKGNLERLFEKNLTDMIRGIRNNKENEAKFISQCMEEIKQELKQDNMAVKANAIAKLTYLQMLGYDIGWAAFNIIEVMSSTKFTFKRIGYLSASQSFSDNTDVLMLTTNLIRKDLNSPMMYESGVALSGLSCFVTQDLARDLANDVVTMLTSSKPYIRKRACLLLYKVFLRYPDALRPTFGRLKEKLEDPDPGVQSAAVNVICELARKNPKNYLSLAPVFFKLMTTSTNNWMLIKIIKLFGALTPLEPRLGKKLIEPLTNLINRCDDNESDYMHDLLGLRLIIFSTSAMSLLYECINTVIAVLISISSEAPGDHTASIQLCVQKLSVLIEDTDQNLKYLGLLAMGKILRTHPKAVQAHKDLVLACLDDKDESIRLRALDLLYGMVSKKNIMEIVKRLLQHHVTAEGSAYRDELLAKIIQICSHNNYQYITNFEWYVSVLVELTRVEGTKHGSLIAEQMLDVAVRVQSIRHFAVSQMALLIENAHVLLSGSAHHRSSMCEVLHAAAWICGEYAEHLRNPQNVLESLLRTKVGHLPGHIQSVFIQNIAKLYSMLLMDAEKEEDWDKIFCLDNLLLSKLPQYEQSECLEVQERACTVVQLIRQIDKLHKDNVLVGGDVAALFDGELIPVAPKAQRKVPVPPGLDLDTWINEPPSESENEPEPEDKPASAMTGFFVRQPVMEQEHKKRYEPSEEELTKVRQARLAEVESNPHYLKSGASSAKRPTDGLRIGSSTDTKLPPVVSLDLQSPLDIPGMVGLDKYMEQREKTITWKKAKKEKKTKGEKKGRKKASAKKESSDEEDTAAGVVHEVYRDTGEMPEGAKSTDDEEPVSTGDPYRALDINLDEPLRDEEKLPMPKHRYSSPNVEDLPTLPKTAKNHYSPPAIVSPTAPPRTRKELKGNKGTEKRKQKAKETTKAGEEKEKKKKKGKSKRITETGEPREADQMDLWLEEDNTQQTPQNDIGQKVTVSTVENDRAVREENKKIKTKESRTKSTSGSAKKDKKSALLEALTGAEDTAQLRVRDRADYEEASGACTPSRQEYTSDPGTPQHPASESPAPTPMPEMSSYKLLAHNQHVRLMYETRVNASEKRQIITNVVITNLSDKQLKQLELMVLDSLNTKLIKETSSNEGVLVIQSLSPSVSNEHQLRFSVDAVSMPQKLRGTVTYTVITENGVVPEKLDFQLRFLCVSFTLPISCSKNSFATLLTSGELSSKSSVKLTSTDPFQTILAKICFHAHFTVVEMVDLSASLYSQTIQEQPLCLLVKQQGGTVQVEGKSTDSQLLSYVLEEIRELLETPSR